MKRMAITMAFGVLAACSANRPPAREPKALVIQESAPDAKPLVMAKPAPLGSERPKLDVVFVLDTTGSMAGLIEGAKQKIWTIADELASAQPAPEIRIGLIAYRDRGDAYVTQRFALTDDIDTVYQQLFSLSADGGGDEPESVNQALHEAVANTPWSQDARTYRTVFLVGDAPPHMDYQDDVPYARTVAEAKQRGIVINTVQCGSSDATRGVWAAIASESEGTYAAIQQNGGMQYIAAPMDEEIGRINAELSSTVLPYGRDERQETTRKKAAMAASADAAASSSRHQFLEKKGGSIVTGGGDLVDDVQEGKVALEAVPASELPRELRAMEPEERKVALAEKARKRAALKSRLDQLVKERSAYVAKETEKRGGETGFDGEVMKTVKAQAARSAGVHYAD